MKLSEELKWRGFLKHTTLKDNNQLNEAGKLTVYLGADPSGDSLHVGHLAVYLLARHFIDYGHKVVLLIGGGTGIIGDPGGREAERQLLNVTQVEANAKQLASQVESLFGGKEFTLVNNYSWLSNLSVIDFLRDTGKHFSMTQLIQRDYISKRIGEGGSGISYAEFSYTLLQGYDFLHLYKNFGVNFQIGGSDQWGNILSGVDLVRKVEGADVNGMTAPLVIDKSTGKKFGKSHDGAVWLSPEKTSPYQFYQFWLQTSDQSVIDYIKLFTLLNEEQVNHIAKEHELAPHKRLAQQVLAKEVTQLVHGRERAKEVEKVTAVLFTQTPVDSLTEAELSALANEIPTTSGGRVTDILLRSGLTKSLGEGRRLINGGAISLNGQKITTDSEIDELGLLKKGKNTFVLVK